MMCNVRVKMCVMFGGTDFEPSERYSAFKNAANSGGREMHVLCTDVLL